MEKSQLTLTFIIKTIQKKRERVYRMFPMNESKGQAIEFIAKDRLKLERKRCNSTVAAFQVAVYEKWIKIEGKPNDRYKNGQKILIQIKNQSRATILIRLGTKFLGKKESFNLFSFFILPYISHLHNTLKIPTVDTNVNRIN